MSQMLTNYRDRCIATLCPGFRNLSWGKKILLNPKLKFSFFGRSCLDRECLRLSWTNLGFSSVFNATDYSVQKCHFSVLCKKRKEVCLNIDQWKPSLWNPFSNVCDFFLMLVNNLLQIDCTNNKLMNKLQRHF